LTKNNGEGNSGSQNRYTGRSSFLLPIPGLEAGGSPPAHYIDYPKSFGGKNCTLLKGRLQILIIHLQVLQDKLDFRITE
jgi:hypothetical protein